MLQVCATPPALAATLMIFLTAWPMVPAAQEKLITIGSTNPTGAAALPFVMAEKKG